MTVVYLGLFSKIFNWVYNKILAPVVNFFSDILSSVLGWIFTNVLGPILSTILEIFFNWWLMDLKLVYTKLLYMITQLILGLVDLMEKAMGFFIGTDDVISKTNGKVSLLEAFMNMSAIRNAFLAMTLLGLGLALILTIYSVTKSALDFDFENKRPISAVLSSFMKSAITFLTTPFIVLVIIRIAAIILSTIENYLVLNSKQTVGSTIFYCITMNAGANESTRKAYLNFAGVNYHNFEDVIRDFNLFNIDYLVGIIVGIFMLFIMFSTTIVFIKRLYEMSLLYLASPLFVATMPLDDGEKYGKWRDMFIAKTFTGFGSLMAMKLYLIMIPELIGSDNLKLGTFDSSDEMSYVLKLIFIIGGAWTMMKAGTMITTLLNYQAGSSEAQTQMGANAFLNTHVSAPIMGKIQQGFSSTANSVKQSFETGKEKEKTLETKQTFRETKYGAGGGMTGRYPGLSGASGGNGYR